MKFIIGILLFVSLERPDSPLGDISWTELDSCVFEAQKKIDMGFNKEGITLLKKAVKMSKREHAWRKYYTYLFKIATTQYSIKNDTEALKNCEELMTGFAGGFLHDSLLVDIFSLKAQIYMRLHIYDSSIVYNNRAISLLQSNPKSSISILSESYRFLARALESAKLYKKAIVNYKLFLDTTPKKNNREIPLALNSIGIMNMRLGHYNQALEFINKAQEVWQKQGGRYSVGVAHALSNKGIIYEKKEKFKQALEYYFRASEILVQLQDKTLTHFIANGYNNIGLAYQNLGLYDESLNYLHKSKDTYTKEYGSDYYSLSYPYTSLGVVYGKIGLNDSALIYHKKALVIRQMKNNDKDPNVSWSYNFIANTHLIEGRYELALEHFHKAILSNLSEYNNLDVYSIPKSHTSLGDEFFVESLIGKANAFVALAKSEQKVELYSMALINLILAKKVLSKMTKEQLKLEDKLHTSSKTREVYEFLISVCYEVYKRTGDKSHLEQMFLFTGESKSRILRNAITQADFKKSSRIPESVLGFEKKVRIKQNYYKTQIEGGHSNINSTDSLSLLYFKDKLFKLNRTSDSLKQIFIEYSAQFHNPNGDWGEFSLKNIQNQLRPTQAVIEYFIGDSSAFIFSITKRNFRVYPIENKNVATDEIKSFRRTLQLSIFGGKTIKNKLINQSRRIFKVYLERVLYELDVSINKLIIIPDSKLSYIPFEILLTRDVMVGIDNYRTLPYLIQEYSIQYMNSSSLLFTNIDRRTSAKGKFVAFAPSYGLADKSDPSIDQFRGQLRALKYNEPEVQNINQYMNGRTLVGHNAQERRFKEVAQNYGILHLAMHAVLDDKDPMNSKLVFTQSSDSIEDNYLHAYELYNMELNAEMIVLSACETGFGKLEKGEGVMSLARAFAYAGCPSVVMTHWAVNDGATAELMTFFYKYLTQGLEKDDAMRKAKLDFLLNAEIAKTNPYFWGAFVVMGDVSPVNINQLVFWSLTNWILFTLLGIFLIAVTVKNQYD